MATDAVVVAADGQQTIEALGEVTTLAQFARVEVRRAAPQVLQGQVI